MSYIPDYRTKANYEALNAEDKAYFDGYHRAITDLMDYLTGSIDCFEDFEEIDSDLLDRLEGRFNEKEQADIIEAIIAEVGHANWVNEMETWCGLIEGAEYLPEEWEPEDLSGGPYIHEENKDRQRGEALYQDSDYGCVEEEGAEE